ncbi:MAG: hypothetical protein R3E08_02440 [Thiotrichaceae bacterium]
MFNHCCGGNKIALIPGTSQLGVTFLWIIGDCVGGNLVTMDKDKKCTANFANTGTDFQAFMKLKKMRNKPSLP